MRTSLRLVAVFTVLFSILAPLVTAYSWDSEDVEIFNVRHKLKRLEGDDDVDFYKYVGVANGLSATTDEISRAYRRRSLAWHPDKRKPGVSVRQAQDRFTLLGLVGEILRNPERRERYDFFLQHGFPEWTGTDYLYSRFRPGLSFTLIFLLLFISGMQYLFHALTASRHRDHVNRYIEEVKEVAWRPHGGNPPVSGARKYVTLADQSEEGTGPSRKFAIDFDGSVYFVDPKTGEESYLDVNEIEGANWKRTLIYVLPVSLWNATVGRVLKKKATNVEEETEGEVEEENGVEHQNGKLSGMGKHTKVEKVAGKRKAKKRN